jgi:hypothetical protein
MEVIEKIKLRGSRGEAEVVAVFDSGATYSCIQLELARKPGRAEILPEPKFFWHRGIRAKSYCRRKGKT